MMGPKSPLKFTDQLQAESGGETKGGNSDSLLYKGMLRCYIN